MKSSADESPNGDHDPNAPLSLGEAARLSGMPREYLEECIASGKLAVHLHNKGDATKFRVSRVALESAGIVPKDIPSLARDPNETLIRLLHDQTARLAAIEEQRFQLAGQLGAALERSRILEERVLALAAASETDDSVEPPAPNPGIGASTSDLVKPTAPMEPPSAEPSPPAPIKLATRIIRLKPPPHWSSRALGAVPGIRGLLEGKRADRT